jgi:hypothetical protein
MNNIFFIRGMNIGHFSRLPDLVSSPPEEVGLAQNPGSRLAKILTINPFLFFKNYVFM